MQISIPELKKLQNPIIIDIRSVENYNNRHIPGAQNISYTNLLIKPNLYLNKNDKYYIYCQHGKTSVGLCNQLNKLGYQTYSIIGGYENWVLEN